MKFSYARVWFVAVLCRKEMDRIRFNRGRIDLNTRRAQLFDEHGAGVARRIGDAEGTDEWVMTGQRRHEPDGKIATERHSATGLSDAWRETRRNVDSGAGRPHHHIVIDSKRGRMRTMLHRGEVAHIPGIDDEVDYVVVNKDGPYLKLVAE